MANETAGDHNYSACPTLLPIYLWFPGPGLTAAGEDVVFTASAQIYKRKKKP